MAKASNVKSRIDRAAELRGPAGGGGPGRVGLAHLSPDCAPTSGSPPQAPRNEPESAPASRQHGSVVGGAVKGRAGCGADVAAESAADASEIADSGLRVVVSPASPRAGPSVERSASSQPSGALFCAIDTETTGLSTQLDRVVEVAALLDDRQLAQLGLQSVDLPRHFQALVRPDVRIPPRASAVHGILDEHVADRPSFGRVRAELCRWLDAWHEASGLDLVLVAHNAAYDRGILMHETRRHCGQLADLHRRAQWSCSLSAFRRKVRWRNAGLPALAKEYLPSDYRHCAHRALGDCRALLDVLHALPEEAGIWLELQRSQLGDART